MKNTKQQILYVALDLFSKRGYSAVSIRDIGKIVGIKESTIYYHFENKQDIFQELLKLFEQITNEKPEKFNTELDKIKKIEKEAFINVGIGILTNYLLQEQILKFIRMLMIEQHVNDEAATLYKRILFEFPIKHNSEVFQTLIEREYFRNADADYIALEYYSPIFFIFQRYFASGEITDKNLQKAMKELRTHLHYFYDKYSI